mgnify:CR=1 FL=1
MTGSALNTLINYYCKTNDTVFTQADKLVLVNLIKDELANLISLRNEQVWVMPAAFDLVASSVTAREYGFPTDILNHIITVELALDTTIPTVFVPCVPYPGGMQRLLRELNGITEAKITNLFNNEQPKYVLMRNSIYVLSGTITALTDGGKLRYRLYPADLANLSGSTDLSLDPTTSSFGFPKGFHELLARKVGINWKSSKPKPIPLSALDLLYKQDLGDALDGVSESDLGAEIVGSLPSEDSPSQLGSNC